MEINVTKLIGKVLTRFQIIDDEEIHITTTEGKRYLMYHDQDCCESVRVAEVIGDIEDLLNSPITMAEEETNSEDSTGIEYPDSFTWTFYKFATIKGYITIRWLGESNGYYSERVDFKQQP